jgi:hypothetical protein
MPGYRILVIAAALAATMVGCGDNDNSNGNSNNNDNDSGPTPVVTATPAGQPTATATAPPQIPCPQQVTYTVESEGSDLDIGWTGIYDNQILGTGGSLSFAVDCPGDFLGACGDCPISGPIASTTIVNNQRCSNGTQTKCTADAECGAGTCEFYFGAPLPIAGGGVPICVVNQVNGAVTGNIQPELGSGTSNIGIIFTSFVGIAESQPCPVCTGATIGASGTCEGGERDGQACITDGTTPFFGNTSFDCPPSASGDIGSSTLPLNLTTGTRELPVTATCTGAAGSGKQCYCTDQAQPNQCHDGICTVDDAGEGTCQGGPTDSLCAVETFRSCTSNVDCPASGDSCTTKLRSCLGPTDASGTLTGPIVRTGTPSAARPIQVGTFCIGATRSTAVNAAAGLAGPGAIVLPTDACIKPTCP